MEAMRKGKSFGKGDHSSKGKGKDGKGFYYKGAKGQPWMKGQEKGRWSNVPYWNNQWGKGAYAALNETMAELMIPDAYEDFSRPSHMFSLAMVPEAPAAARRNSKIEVKNSFQELQTNDDEDADVQDDSIQKEFPMPTVAPRLKGGAKMPRWNRMQKKVVKRRVKQQGSDESPLPTHIKDLIEELRQQDVKADVPISYLGGDQREPMVSHVVDGHAGEWEEICMVMDSGAADAVAPDAMAESIPITESPGSRQGQHFMTADGTRIPNKGQKSFTAVSEEGQRLGLTFQIADVSRPLASVGKMCDNHKAVLFMRKGGYVIDLNTGDRTRFNREEGVYIMKTWAPKTHTSANRRSPAPGFARQG